MKVKVRIHADPLAVKLTAQLFELDPYNGLFFEEALKELDAAVKTPDGLRSIIENDIEMIKELHKVQDDLLDRENKLIETIRKYEPNYGLYSGGVQV